MKTFRFEFNSLFSFFIALLLFITFIPFFTTIQHSIVMGFVIVIGLIAYPEIKTRIPFLELCIFVIVIVSYFLLGKGLAFNFYGLAYWILQFASAVVIGFGLEHLKNKQLSFLLIILIGLMIYSNISTIVVSLVNPMALRTFGYNSVEENLDLYSSLKNSLGPIIMYSYGVGEAMSIIAPTLLAFSLRAKRKILKLFGIIAVSLSIVSQALAALTASLFLTVFFSFLVVLSHLHLSQTKKKIRTFIFLVVILIISSQYFVLISKNNYLLADKFGDILTLLTSGNSTGDVSVRSGLLLQSFNAWISNPIFGWSDVGGIGIDNGVSMHSALFDYLGLYGLFSLLLIDSWRRILVTQFRYFSTTEHKYYRWGVLSLIFLLIIKGPVTIGVNVFFSIGLCGLIIRSSILGLD